MPAKAENHAELLRCMPGGCLIVDDGVIIAANAEALETTGLALGRLIGVAVADLLVPESRLVWNEALTKAATSSTTSPARLSNALTPVEFTLRRLYDDLIAVGVRSMAPEYYYSALARAELTHDPLTGFANRYHLLSQLQERLARRPRANLAIIGLWVDELPDLVTTRGERTVERVIKDVGSRLQRRLRSPDVLGRFDEAGFVTLLTSDATVSQLTTIADRLREEVAFPVEFDNELVSFTASVALAPLAGRRPAIERVLSELDAVGPRTAASGGDQTELLEL